MEVIFYDKKNKREVSSKQLMEINFTETTVLVDSEGECNGTTVSELYNKELYIKRYQIGNLGYKSETCPDWKNWDLYLLESDLVFLRLEND